MSADETFLSRWSRRKRANAIEEAAPPAQSPASQSPPLTEANGSGRGGEQGNADPATKPGAPSEVARATAAAPAGEGNSGGTGDAVQPLPSIESLRPDSDFTAFMQAGVDPSTRSAALGRLFTDPHFNRIDGLDIYLDDYGKPDPIPLAMLKMMNQAHNLGLFSSDDGEGDHGDPPAAGDAERADVAASGEVADDVADDVACGEARDETDNATGDPDRNATDAGSPPPSSSLS